MPISMSFSSSVRRSHSLTTDSALPHRGSPRRRHFAAIVVSFLVVVMIASIQGQALAQEPALDADEVFEALLEQGKTLDETRKQVGAIFGSALSTGIAVELCSPRAHPKCENSIVFEAWDEFFDGIDAGGTASQVVQVLQPKFGSYLATGIAVFWCSPQPGDGCERDPIAAAWSTFDAVLNSDNPNPARAIAEIRRSAAGPIVAEFVAAVECGEPTCFSDELLSLAPEDFGNPNPVESTTKQKPDPNVKYGVDVGRSDPNWLSWACKLPAISKAVASCQKRTS